MNIKTIKLKKIDLLKTGFGNDNQQAENCEHPDIDGRKNYLVKYAEAWMIGKFERQRYGWCFDWYGTAYAGLQLDALDEVWEIVGGI